MSSLATYQGLQVITPAPTGAGGLAINNNFKALSTHIDTVDPTSSNDGTQGFSVGSRWVNTTTTLEWVCLSAATGSAVWQAIPGTLGSYLPLAGGTMTGSLSMGGNTLGGLASLQSTASLLTIDNTVGQVKISGATGISLLGNGSPITTDKNTLDDGSGNAAFFGGGSFAQGYAFFDSSGNLECQAARFFGSVIFDSAGSINLGSFYIIYISGAASLVTYSYLTPLNVDASAVGIQTVSGGPTTFGGQINMPNLPTSSTGLAAGAVWRNGTVLNIV